MNFQMSGDIDEPWVPSGSLAISNKPLFTKDRVPYSEAGPFFKNSINEDRCEFKKLTDNLYKRVDKGKDIDSQYPRGTGYIIILPETHPAFNFYNFYYLYTRGVTDINAPANMQIANHYSIENIASIITTTFPEYARENNIS